MRITDGVKAVADEEKCYWFLDSLIVILYQF